MIGILEDITNIIMDKINKEIGKTVNVMKSYQFVTPKFPTVTIESSDNSVLRETIDSGGIRHNSISFSINIFTHGNRKGIESDKIQKQVDDIMYKEFGLIRVGVRPVPNYMDSSVYRVVMNYVGIIDENKTIYGR